LNEVTFDLDIWLASWSWRCLGQLRRSGHRSKVHGHEENIAKMLGATSSSVVWWYRYLFSQY